MLAIFGSELFYLFIVLSFSGFHLPNLLVSETNAKISITECGIFIED